jgi:hypothetical protein
MITRHFNDVQSAVLAQTATLDAVQLIHATGQQTIVAWARGATSTTIEIPAMTDKAYRISYGTITILRPQNGVYSLTLPPATCESGEGCYLGGTPAIIVQPQGNITINEISSDNESVTITFFQE